ncbi:MAG: PAS domain S-box protein [Ktedonobacterales bacterium]
MSHRSGGYLSIDSGVLDVLPDQIAVLDQSGTIVAVNGAWKRFAHENAGDTLTSGVGRNYLEVCRAASNEETARRVLDGLQAMLAGTQLCFTLEYPCHPPTRRRWFLLRAMPLPGDQPGAVVMHTDVTARKLAEEEQARLFEAAQAARQDATQQAQQFQAVLAAIPDGVVVFDEQGRMILANAFDQQLLGDEGTTARSPEPVEGRARRLELQDADGVPLPAEEIPAVRVLHGEVLSCDHAVDVYAHAADGRKIELSVTGAPVDDAEGRRRGGVLIYRDVTTERQAARRIQQTIESAPDATVVADPTGRIQLVNRQTEEIFGYARRELLGQPAEQLIPAGLHRTHQRHRAEYAAAPRARPMGASLALFGRHRDGTEFPVEVRLGPLGDTDSWTIASIRDVSELQRIHTARREAEHANEELRRLQALTDVALAHLRLDDLLSELLGRVQNVMAVDTVAILLLDAHEHCLRVQAARGLDAEVLAHQQVPIDQGFAGRIAVSRAPLVVDDLSTFPGVSSFLPQHVRSALGAPLLLQDRVLGVLHVGTAEPHHFTEPDVQLLQHAAEHIATAVERAQMFEAEQTARQETQAALDRERASETRFRRLVESGIIGMVIGDTKQVLEANDAYLQMLGYTHEELLAGRLTTDALLPPEDITLMERAVNEALTAGAAEPIECKYIRKDGSRLPVLVGLALLEQTPPRFVSFVVDLSERKQLEHSLLESERLFRATFEQAAVGMARVAPDGRWLEVNRRLCEIVGYRREELMKHTFQDLTHPEDLEDDLEYLREMLAGKRNHFAIEIRFVRKGGSLVWAQLTVALVRDAGGNPEYFISVVEDITARKQAEEALQASEERLRLFVEHAPAAVAMFDREMCYLSMSRRWMQDFHLEGNLLGRSHYEVFPELPARWRAIHRRCLGGAVEQSDEDRFERLDGSIQWLRWEVRPWFIRSGEVGGIVVFSEDITERKRLEREREEARASELAAQEVAQQMDQFFAMASHDIRSPITAVSANLQLARARAQRLVGTLQARGGQDAELTKPLMTALDGAHASMRSLLRLVTLLFDVARIRSGTLPVTLVRCNLVALVREQVTGLQAAAPDRIIELNLPDLPVMVMADADRLGQILTNYVTNALKYSSDDQPVVVYLEVREGLVTVSVQDHGPGLPWEEQSRVWELYHRAPGVKTQGSVSANGESLGLGLHICKRLMELHPGGEVGVESVVGQGSTFWFRLPLAADSEQEASIVGTDE